MHYNTLQYTRAPYNTVQYTRASSIRVFFFHDAHLQQPQYRCFHLYVFMIVCRKRSVARFAFDYLNSLVENTRAVNLRGSEGLCLWSWSVSGVTVAPPPAVATRAPSPPPARPLLHSIPLTASRSMPLSGVLDIRPLPWNRCHCRAFSTPLPCIRCHYCRAFSMPLSCVLDATAMRTMPLPPVRCH